MSEGDQEEIRSNFEKAIANVPPSKEKQYWRRYIYLWINYAVYEEMEAQDMDRARQVSFFYLPLFLRAFLNGFAQVYRTCLDLIPHKRFTFAKMWLWYAQFELRQKDVTKARQALGCALGKCPKAKLFRGYIDMEIQLREFHRCRTLYAKFLEFDPENCAAWMKFAELETLLGECRGFFELR